MGDLRSSEKARDHGPRDIGALWTLTRGESRARCVLLSVADGVEVRVVLDGAALESERCERFDEAFELAERWRARMTNAGWRRLLPVVPFPD